MRFRFLTLLPPHIFYYEKNQYKIIAYSHPLHSYSFCRLQPEKQVVVKLIYGDQSCTLTALSALNEDTIPYTEALKRATDYCAEYITSHTENGKLKAEISVRLLTENGNNYYYVGFTATDGEKKAVLIDGETGSVLAEKNN